MTDLSSGQLRFLASLRSRPTPALLLWIFYGLTSFVSLPPASRSHWEMAFQENVVVVGTRFCVDEFSEVTLVESFETL